MSFSGDGETPSMPPWLSLTDELDYSWKNDVMTAFEYYTERTPGAFIEHKKSSITWHYRLADPQYGSWQAKECQAHLESLVIAKFPIEILVGKKNLEVSICFHDDYYYYYLIAIR